jgi:SAM-dependent methyltransferase
MNPDSSIETRSIEELRAHYEVEKELANRLRGAARDDRRHLYRSVYNELFQRVQNHPQLTRKTTPESHTWAIQRQLKLVEPFLPLGQATFLEVGAGDCALSAAVAQRAESVISIDVSDEVVTGVDLPSNVRVLLSDGVSIDVPPDTIDVAFSNSVMEHLHPDDALEQVNNIHRALKPGGVYICITPNRLSGPHDISKYFDESATGFHLKEYTVGELHRLFLRVGFAEVKVYVGGKGRYLQVTPALVEAFEVFLGRLPTRWRRLSAERFMMSAVLGARAIGIKVKETSEAAPTETIRG